MRQVIFHHYLIAAFDRSHSVAMNSIISNKKKVAETLRQFSLHLLPIQNQNMQLLHQRIEQVLLEINYQQYLDQPLPDVVPYQPFHSITREGLTSMLHTIETGLRNWQFDTDQIIQTVKALIDELKAGIYPDPVVNQVYDYYEASRDNENR